MRKNILWANDVILAEAVVFALAKVMDRAKADELVKKATAVASSEGKPLIDVVKNSTIGMIPAEAVDWQALALPENYLGSTEAIIERVLQYATKLSLS